MRLEYHILLLVFLFTLRTLPPFFHHRRMTYTVTLSMDGPMDGIAVGDVGPAVASIFNNPQEYIGKKLGLSGEKITNQVSLEVYAKFSFLGANDLAAMLEFYSTANPDHSITLTRELNPTALNFKTWAEKNKDKISA